MLNYIAKCPWLYFSPYVEECPIEGQVYTDCGTACPPMCNKPQPLFCTLQCVAGCQCPSGTVLDELQNKCVKADECSKNTFSHVANCKMTGAVLYSSLSTSLLT